MNVNADVIAIEVTFAEKQPGSAEGLRQTLLRTPVLSEVFSADLSACLASAAL